jgi:hypothetical protein
MLTHQYRNKNPRSCEVVLQREGFDVETFYWAGSIEEVRELAQEIAFKGGAAAFGIVEFPAAANDGLCATTSGA